MVKRKRAKEHTVNYKALHRKPTIAQHESHKEKNSVKGNSFMRYFFK
jgi:hypothetical protein